MILVSGGFDPIHPGHVRYIKSASKIDSVVVALNSDAWLFRKKGYVFMPFEDRKEILMSISGVVGVYAVDDSDGTVCEAIKTLMPIYFAKGGDRTQDNTPEVSICKQLGVEIIWNCGGGKSHASSEIVKKKWGEYKVLYEDGFKVKLLTLLPGKSTSLQKHFKRNEHWVFPETDEYKFVNVGQTHKLENNSDRILKVVEIQTGQCFEEDIERYD